MWRHYVYEHVRNDTGAVFYVGKGAFRKNRKPHYERAVARGNRNVRWHRTVAAAGGFTVNIVAHFQTDDDAATFEIARIAEHGRANLSNFTDGGDGRRNGVFSEAERQKRREHASKKRSPAWVASIRAARKNGGNGGVVKRGDKLPQWWRDKIAATKRGADNPMYGRTGAAHPKSRAVIDDASGVSYPSIVAATRVAGISMQHLHAMLTGAKPNKTTMRLV